LIGPFSAGSFSALTLIDASKQGKADYPPRRAAWQRGRARLSVVIFGRTDTKIAIIACRLGAPRECDQRVATSSEAAADISLQKTAKSAKEASRRAAGLGGYFGNLVWRLGPARL
jgi:hypothetical protein